LLSPLLLLLLSFYASRPMGLSECRCISCVRVYWVDCEHLCAILFRICSFVRLGLQWSVVDPSARIICACSAAFSVLCFLCALTHLSFLRISQVSISYWEISTRSCESVAYHFRMYVSSASLFFIFSAARLAFSGLNRTSHVM
jgi:hypothetical protein